MVAQRPGSAPALKKVLERFYRQYDFKERLLHDPIEFPHRYKKKSDQEMAAFIASCLAYGKVGLFKAVLEEIFSKMGSSPHDFILGADLRKQKKLLSGIKYRFNENEDILCLLFILKKVLQEHGSLGNLFRKGYHDGDLDIGPALASFMEAMLSVDTAPIYGRDLHPAGLLQFFSSPANGSACKRAVLFLRWMIRDRDIDLGIWQGIPKNRLVIPLDTHIAKISRCLGLSSRKSQDWKMAVEITEALKKFDPEDPLKYDFALCHHGISGLCKGEKRSETCRECVFNL